MSVATEALLVIERTEWKDRTMTGDVVADLIDQGRAALRNGDAARARDAFELARVESDAELEPGAVLDGLAHVAYLELDFITAIELWERAYGRYRAEGECVRVVTVARALAGMYGMVVGDWAVMNGWLSRAQTLMGDNPDHREQGWVALSLGMFEPDRQRKNERFQRAVATARVTGDIDLEVVALAYAGASLVHEGHVEDGMTMLDEAMAAVAGGEIDDFFLFEEIFCQLFSACEYARDVVRADQWISIGDSIAARLHLPAVSAFCRTHYAGVLTAAGRWTEAANSLSAAIEAWDLSRRSQLRTGALVRLADLRVRQGRLEEAQQLLVTIELSSCGEAARPVAAIHFARGELGQATSVLEAALIDTDRSQTSAVPLLELLVEVDLAAQRTDAASSAADELSAIADCTDSDYVRAVAALARARVCKASGDSDQQRHLRAALAAFSRARMPFEIAVARLALASALGEDSRDVAIAEARAALDTFRTAEASRCVDEALSVLRTLGVKEAAAGRTPGELTKRELDVLELIGEGLSNPEIASRLYVSRKTVEYHVGNVLAKLALRSRAEAAAYATRNPVRKPGPVLGSSPIP